MHAAAQVPVLHLWSEAAIPPPSLLAQYLPPVVAALLPMDILQVRNSGHRGRRIIFNAVHVNNEPACKAPSRV